MNAALLITAGIGLFFLVVWLLKWLWNMTMPVVFSLRTITYWQAFRILLIASILFGRPQAKRAARQGREKTVQEKVHTQEMIEPSK
jgi:uncharacterized membrane-anchored protein